MIKPKFFSLMLVMMTLGALSACSKAPTMAEQGPQAYPMLDIKKGNITLTQEFPATVKGVNDIDIYPQVNGTITEVGFKEGTKVQKGHVLFKINPTAYEAKYERAKANVANAKAQLETTRFNRTARQKLANQGAVSKYEAISAENNFEAAQATLSEMESELKAAKEDLDHTIITSPVTGYLGMSDIRVGTLVSTNMTKPLVSVSDNSYFRAYFSLTESMVLFIEKMDDIRPNEDEKADSNHDNDDENAHYPVKFRMADNTEYPIKGYIDAMSGIVDPTTGAVNVRATFMNTKGLIQSGGSGSVIVPIELEDQIIIPQTATFELQDKIFVYRFVDGKAKATPVKLLWLNNGTHYVVTDGLKEGDVIVTNGAGLLQNGTPITRQAEKTDKVETASNTQKDNTPAAPEQKGQ